ncbi:MAG: phosphotransferase [Roseovarius sp.]
MADRAALIDRFVAQAGWGAASRKVIAGDASNRRYLRLFGEGGATAVLMDAPPEKDEDVRPFLFIARHLSGLGFSAPRIIAADEAHGFLLLEDLGDDLFARVLERDIAREAELYTAATDLLVELHKAPPPRSFEPYGPELMTERAGLSVEWYCSGATGTRNERLLEALCAEIEPVLAQHAGDADVLVQRDYHAENLLWLPRRDGVARVGLLDFQDAMSGHRAYDLVSLLEDARRDVSPDVADAMRARYIAAAGQDAESFTAAFHVLGAQRNLRIIGVFARLCIRDGKAHYVDLIPRVWAHLQHDLTHPALAAIRALVETFPEPGPETLTRLKSLCATHQAP